MAEGQMRKINTRDFRVATRGTSRDINRRIALNLIREHQPISRADLARRMNVTRGVVSVLVQELIDQDVIYEGVTGETRRGRKPTFLHIRTHDRLAIAVDVRFSNTHLMVCDFAGKQLALERYATIFSPGAFLKELSLRVRRIAKNKGFRNSCEGIGVAVPGMVDHRTGRVLNAPTLGWTGVEIRDHLAAATGFPVQIENSARACALAQLWLERGESRPHSFAYVTISDGVGVGIVINGELLRGHDYIAGEFGHVPLDLNGPRCMCGAQGCWEAYTSNLAMISRYFGCDVSKLRPKGLRSSEQHPFGILELIGRARAGDGKAIAALETSARYLGVGLANIVNAINPDCVYLSGEITTGWDMIESIVRRNLTERALTSAGAHAPLRLVSIQDYPRLKGAAALIAAPAFAAPRVA
jgi:N-acetylglucosamine repressor